jgi:hypothetical protein
MDVGWQILSHRIHGRYEAIHLRIQPARFQQPTSHGRERLF